MEEFRPFLGDRLALSLINLRQVQDKGFKKSDSGAVLMSDDTRKTVLVAYQERKQEEIIHPFLDEKVSIGLLFHIQALLLARHLRGDLDGYPPFIWK
jgi:CRISPR-associated protein Cas1